MAKRSANPLKTYLLQANLFALAGGAAASAFTGNWLAFGAAAGASVLYSALVTVIPGYRRLVQSSLRELDGVEAPETELESMLRELAPSQRDHYLSLKEVRDRILESYARLPGGGVLAASSQPRFDALLTSFLRLVGTLNGYRKFLSAHDRQAIEVELKQLEEELPGEKGERLREVKGRRVDILKKRLQRYAQAEESREVVSHQLASIEDVLRLTHEQSIAIRDPEAVGRQLEALTAEVAATEETVKEMEQFMDGVDDVSSSVVHGAPERVR